jgi:hypothetical protein
VTSQQMLTTLHFSDTARNIGPNERAKPHPEDEYHISPRGRTRTLRGHVGRSESPGRREVMTHPGEGFADRKELQAFALRFSGSSRPCLYDRTTNIDIMVQRLCYGSSKLEVFRQGQDPACSCTVMKPPFRPGSQLA